jgi:hypothetical protein
MTTNPLPVTRYPLPATRYPPPSDQPQVSRTAHARLRLIMTAAPNRVHRAAYVTIGTEGRCWHPPPIPAKEIQMSDDELRAELERLREENASLKKGASRGVSLKVSEKGGLSVYGLGRFPVTLYKEQWVKLLDMSDEIRTFLKAHDAELKTKE